MRLLCFCAVMACLISSDIFAQANRWQQKVEYDMTIDFEVKDNTFKGTQTLTYYNNSEETLDRVYYHLYFNAFQPGSAMDIRNKLLPDSDPRVKGRIGELKTEEMGYLHAKTLTQDGVKAKFEESETILEVELARPIPPNGKTVLKMTFEGQVPVQIRRSGRDNAEGIEYSMTQWYPKLCEYDYQGWHANPYIGREFYGVWGDFDVKINIADNYILGGTGYIQTGDEIGYGYQSNASTAKTYEGKGKLTWHFKAPNVHDFAWAADPDYTHDIVRMEDGFDLHFIYENKDVLKGNWVKLQDFMKQAYGYIKKRFGAYPYKQYTFIQGGDGGMEYPMCTLITGKRNLTSLVGVSVHEWMHTWYQMLMGTNESLHAWMDEGFTSWASDEVMAFLKLEEKPQVDHYAGYFDLAESGQEEPLSTHADHFNSNYAYGVASYSKGAVLLHQLSYIIGQKALDAGLLDYYNTWRFKHPNPNDFIRIMELRSGLELDWYKEYFVYSTKQIDYAIKSVSGEGKKTNVTLERVGKMPMPIDLEVEYKDGSRDIINIPLDLMRGAKPKEDKDADYSVAADWHWVMPTYELCLPVKEKKIKRLTIDPTNRLADVKRENNSYNAD